MCLFFCSKFILVAVYLCSFYSLTMDRNPIEIENDDNIEQRDFPQITISALNCNTLNMATIAKHARLRKFYGICSLKTDIILLSDLRMCNKSGNTDMQFINDTFAINPHSSYKFFHHSRSNVRGVGMLIKKRF